MRRWAIVLTVAAVLAVPPYSAPPDPPTAAIEPLTGFVPRPDGRNDRLDYSVWTEALAAFVV